MTQPLSVVAESGATQPIAEGVVKQLTKAQREALTGRVFEHSKRGLCVSGGVDGRIKRRLCFLRLTFDYIGHSKLTPLGLAVRSLLEKEAGR